MPTIRLIEFFLYLVPGFIALEIYRARHPAKKTSDFTRATWSVVYGVVIYAAVRWVDDILFSGSLRGNTSDTDVFPNAGFIIILFLVGICVGLLQIGTDAARFHLGTRINRLGWLTPGYISIWSRINAPTNNDWAVVFLRDGATYIGSIAEYSFDPNAEDQDFLLSNAKRVDEQLNEQYSIDGLGVYLNTRDVRRIEFLQGE